MEITHGAEMSYQDTGAKHRSGALEFKYLSLGAEGTKENFMFVLARQKGFFSPRHHHNFDQFRFAIKGDFNLGPGLDLKQGQLAYHPEGVHYGPQNDGPQEQILLVLQFGGASEQGFLSLDQIKKANGELLKKGRFQNGKYYVNGGDTEKPVDGYEAAWSYAMGGKQLVYPKGRYSAPIIMDPDAFEYKAAQENVKRKLLGVFSERETVAQMWKVDRGGELTIGSDNAIHLLYVLGGEAVVNGQTEVKAESVVRLLPGSSAKLSTQAGFEALHFVMPMFE